MNGYFNISKPTGMSSAAVVAVMRRLTGVRRTGHAGTLDPEAAGVLPIMTGKATRLFDYLTDKEKEYVAVCAFGTGTDTQDATGHITETGDQFPDRESFLKAARQLTGDIIQTPSMYSAIKVRGKPLYQLARRGETIEVPARKVHIESIELLRETADHCFEIRVRCGRGTYIRTLCADIGSLCHCPAHMKSLIRTQSGAFRIENAVSLDEAAALAKEGRLRDRLLPPDYGLDFIPRADFHDGFAKKIRNGSKLPVIPVVEDLKEHDSVRVYLNGQFWGIAARSGAELAWKVQIAPDDEAEGEKTVCE